MSIIQSPEQHQAVTIHPGEPGLQVTQGIYLSESGGRCLVRFQSREGGPWFEDRFGAVHECPEPTQAILDEIARLEAG